jgi:hypothetical protein
LHVLSVKGGFNGQVVGKVFFNEREGALEYFLQTQVMVFVAVEFQYTHGQQAGLVVFHVD